MASMAGGQNGGGPGEGSGAPRMPPPAGPTDGGASPVKKRKSRSGNKRKKKNRRQSFAASSEASDLPPVSARRPSLLDVPETAVTPGPSPFGLAHKSRSSTSLESEALLDHRCVTFSRVRSKYANVVVNIETSRIHGHVDQACSAPPRRSAPAMRIYNLTRGAVTVAMSPQGHMPAPMQATARR